MTNTDTIVLLERNKGPEKEKKRDWNNGTERIEAFEDWRTNLSRSEILQTRFDLLCSLMRSEKDEKKKMI